MSRGLLFFAYNNEACNYVEMATAACAAGRYYHDEEVQGAIITDTSSWETLNEKTQKTAEQVFNHIVFADMDYRVGKDNSRVFRDTNHAKQRASWHNGSRRFACELSPFDETLLLDSDYLTQSKGMTNVWGSVEDFMINRGSQLLRTKQEQPDHIAPFSIPLYWATAIYFQKTKRTRILFDLVGHIQENYEYYQFVYGFKGKLYRNDFAFSIAIHMLSGFMENTEFASLPVKYLTSADLDELHHIYLGGSRFLVGTPDNDWEFTIAQVDGVDTHVMNKFSLCRQTDRILDLYQDHDVRCD